MTNAHDMRSHLASNCATVLICLSTMGLPTSNYKRPARVQRCIAHPQEPAIS